MACASNCRLCRRKDSTGANPRRRSLTPVAPDVTLLRPGRLHTQFVGRAQVRHPGRMHVEQRHHGYRRWNLGIDDPAVSRVIASVLNLRQISRVVQPSAVMSSCGRAAYSPRLRLNRGAPGGHHGRTGEEHEERCEQVRKSTSRRVTYRCQPAYSSAKPPLTCPRTGETECSHAGI
jgi:hypothetical protein